MPKRSTPGSGNKAAKKNPKSGGPTSVKKSASSASSSGKVSAHDTTSKKTSKPSTKASKSCCKRSAATGRFTRTKTIKVVRSEDDWDPRKAEERLDRGDK